MARISNTLLIGLPVVTESGQPLGTVRSFDVDVETHTIVRYMVNPGGIVAIVSGRKDLIIRAEQVVRITKKEMVVHDAVIPLHAENHDRRDVVFGKDAVPILPRDMQS